MMLIDEDTGLGHHRRTPWHVWVVGGIALVWNAFGATDYVMTQLQHEEYMSAFSDEQREFFYTMPAWAVAGWAVAIWSSVIGSVLILARNRFAAPAFLAALAGMAVSFGHDLTSGSMHLLGGAGYLVMMTLVAGTGAGLYFYARWMNRYYGRSAHELDVFG